MTLRLFNTETQAIEDFQPISAQEVLIYSCGPTVYNDLHIGNWSAYVYWDVLVRVLLANGYTPKQVINITDVGHLVSDEDTGEDKLEVGAKREGLNAWEVANKYTTNFLEGRKQLNLLPPAKLAKATNYIDQQIAMAQKLKDKGYIYQTSDGLYFDTSKFPAYSKFARLNLKAQKSGTRPSINPEKINQSDFAIWKFSPNNQQRDMEWKTPPSFLTETLPGTSAPMGFPGWHLECSAIIKEELANTIDIHTGGIDHIPVHHTNEIAQSLAANEQPLANYWLHNNHMVVDGIKISKSLNNSLTLADLYQNNYSAQDFKMLVLQSHYQSQANFTFKALTGAKNRLNHWREIASLRHQIYKTINTAEEELTFLPEPKLLLEILNNNLNTPGALSFIDGVFSKIANSNKPLDQLSFKNFLLTIDELLGLDLINSTPDVSDHIKQLILERRAARERKDYERSDQIRQELSKLNVGLRDLTKNSYWYYLS